MKSKHLIIPFLWMYLDHFRNEIEFVACNKMIKPNLVYYYVTTGSVRYTGCEIRVSTLLDLERAMHLDLAQPCMDIDWYMPMQTRCDTEGSHVRQKKGQMSCK